MHLYSVSSQVVLPIRNVVQLRLTHVANSLAMTAGVVMYDGSLAITQLNVVLKSKSHVRKSAIVKYLDIAKYSAANGYLIITQKQSASMKLNATMLMIAELAKELFASHSADGFLNIAGNTSAAILAAHRLA